MITVVCEVTYQMNLRRGEQMAGDMRHKGGLKKTAPGADNSEPIFQIPVGLPSLVRGRRVKKIHNNILVGCKKTLNIVTM